MGCCQQRQHVTACPLYVVFMRNPTCELAPALQSLIYALVQAGVRPNLAAWLDVGPSRAMQGLMAKNSELVQKKVRWALWQTVSYLCSLPHIWSAGVCRAAGHLLRQNHGRQPLYKCTRW
jgi:hypothetical protein